MSERAKKWLWHGLVLALTLPSAFIYCAQGHDWGDDFALYIIQALQLVGEWPGNSGYIFNQYRPTLGPPEYPWGMPLLLAPVAAAFGNNMTAFLVWMKVIFLAFYQAVFLFGSKTVGRIGALVVAVALAYNPFFLEFKNEVMSDVPFALFVLLALWATTGQNRWHIGLGILFTALAVLTREAGLALVLGFGAYAGVQWFKNGQRLSAIGISGWAAMVGGLVHVVQVLAYRGGYASHFVNYHPSEIVLNNANFMAEVLAYRLFNGWYGPHHAWAMAGSIISIGLLMAGSIHAISKRDHAWPWVALAFMALFLLFPFSSRGFRFLVPLLPLILLAVGGPLKAFTLAQTIAVVSFAALTLTLNHDLLTWMRQKEPFTPEGPQQPHAQNAFAFVRDSLPPNAVLLFDKPRALSLYAHRSALCAPDDSLRHKLPELLAKHGVTHIMTCVDVPNDATEHWLRENSDKLLLCYAGDGVKIWKREAD